MPSLSKTSELYQLAEQEGIPIIHLSVPLCGSVSLQQDNGRCYIGLDDMPITQERVHLAHELGHCLTGSFYNRYSPYDVRAKHEHRADKWAIHRLIPRESLEQAVAAGRCELWELAEYFEVTEEFINKAVNLYAPEVNCYAKETC